MALIEDLVSAEILGVNVVTGLAVGAAALVVTPVVAPLLRPLAKTMIKGGILAYNGAAELYKEAASGVTEFVDGVQRESERNRRDSGVSANSRSR
jgi:hypothetical protein